MDKLDKQLAIDEMDTLQLGKFIHSQMIYFRFELALLFDI